MSTDSRPFAVVTSASTGSSYELAKCCAMHGFDLVVATGVAHAGFTALMAGQAGTVAGRQNKLQVARARLAGAQFIAKLHGKMMDPGSGRAPSKQSHDFAGSNGRLQ